MWARKLAMYADKAESHSKWREDDEEKLTKGLDNLKTTCKDRARKGDRSVSFFMVGPVLGFSLGERTTISLQTDRVRRKVSSYFFSHGLGVRWSLEPFRDLWVVDFPRQRNHVHIGKACDVWKATLSW